MSMSNGNGNGKLKLDEANLGRSRSGRVFVIIAALTLAITWGSLFLVFRSWRTRHRELAAFGSREVAPLVDPLADRVPPKVDAKEWRNAVKATHGMLEVATGSGTIDRPGMEHLRDELRERFANTTADTAPGELSDLWDKMEKEVGPILKGHPSRPPFCPARPKLLGGKGE